MVIWFFLPVVLSSADTFNKPFVDVESDINLGHTSRSRWDTVQIECSQRVVVLSEGSLTLEDLDVYTWLVVSVGGEHLGLLGRDCGVTLDQRGHDTSCGLDTQSQWGNIQQQQPISLLGLLSGQDGGLHGGTISDGLIRVDGLVQFFASEEVGYKLLDTRNTGGSSDQHDIMHTGLVHLGVLKDLLARGQTGS